MIERDETSMRAANAAVLDFHVATTTPEGVAKGVSKLKSEGLPHSDDDARWHAVHALQDKLDEIVAPASRKAGETP